jgi:DNA polymerase I-like protein with 3'-5' exonuclease and polymerase domains
MSTHDEIAALPEKSKTEQCKVEMKEIMEERMSWWPSLPLNADIHSAVRYGEAK